jgi:hypothetical protein
MVAVSDYVLLLARYEDDFDIEILCPCCRREYAISVKSGYG